jgi:RNA polymerase sigma-70 factor (ECF subfamily)
MDIPPEIVAQEYGITTNNVNNRILRTKHWLNKELQKIYTDEDEDS